MSPEQVKGLRVDHRTDIFSLGLVLYEMLTGHRAFRGETAAETMAAILKEDVADFSGSGHAVPLSLDRLVRRCLEKRPEERFQSACDLAISLEAYAGSDASHGVSAVAAPATRAWTRYGPKERTMHATPSGLPMKRRWASSRTES